MKLRRLEAADAPAFQRLRIEGFALQPREFRYAPEDEADMPLAEVAARLERDFVVGVFDGDTLVGIAGLTRHGGVKISHKASAVGHVSARRISREGGADMLMSAILDHARGRVEIVTLTAMSDNPRALAFYRRWGFVAYGVEPAAVKYEGRYFDETLMSLRLA